MSGAERLAEAAKVMRERAEVAQKGGAQWTGTHYWVEDYDPSDPSGQTSMQRLVGGMDAPDCDHYSSWHPAVALAVADVLDVWADHDLLGSSGSLAEEKAAILAVADAYLGTAS